MITFSIHFIATPCCTYFTYYLTSLVALFFLSFFVSFSFHLTVDFLYQFLWCFASTRLDNFTDHLTWSYITLYKWIPTTWELRHRSITWGRGPCGVIVKAMDSGIVVREFVLQSHNYVHFRANTLGKGMKPPYAPSYELNSTTTVIIGEWIWH